jgi:uncharacterized protein
VNFEWDETKRQTNLEKHGLDFADSERIFEWDTWEIEDTRFDYDKPRYIIFGLLEGRVVILVYTNRDEKIRVISLRKADKDEQILYFQAITN